MKRARVYALCALAMVIPGCGCGADKSREDSHDLTRVCAKGAEDPGACVDKSAKRVIANHNGFPNVSTECDGHGHRLFVTTKNHSSRLIAMTDPTCPGYVKQSPQAVSSP